MTLIGHNDIKICNSARLADCYWCWRVAQPRLGQRKTRRVPAMVGVARSQANCHTPRPRSVMALASAPRNAIRPSNLKWELPIAAATGLLIASSDDHINSHIQSLSFAQAASRGSSVGLGIELGTAGLMYLVGCPGHRSSYVANTGFTALEAMGAANLMTLAVKVATNRQYAYHTSPHGEFWEGGRSSRRLTT